MGALRSNSTTKTVEIPPMKTLRWVAFTTGLPFVGFGFMDNAILIVAGDAIDNSLGVSLGISTMCAAAIGNTISDLVGIGCAAYIEEFCATVLKLPVPKLSSAQRQLRPVRMASQIGMAIGMTIGCIVGMLPLLFIDTHKADRLKERARLERLNKDVLNEAKSLVEAESTCLYLRVDKNDDSQQKEKDDGILPDYHPSVNGEYLYAMYYVAPHHYDNQNQGSSTKDTLMRMVSGGALGIPSKTPPPVAADNDTLDAATPSKSLSADHHTGVIPVGKGIISRAVLTGTTWNIAGNLVDEPDFYPFGIEKSRGNIDPKHYRDCAIIPIFDGKGQVIAVLEALNKKVDAHQSTVSSTTNPTLDTVDGGFTDEDVEILVSLASHVSVSLQKIYKDGKEGDEEEFGRLRDTIRILKEGKENKRSIARGNSMAREDADSTSASDNTTPNLRRKTQVVPEYPAQPKKENKQLFPE